MPAQKLHGVPVGLMFFEGARYGRLARSHSVVVKAPRELADDPAGDPAGDRLDALLCAIQAAWAWTMRGEGYGAPEHLDPLEGWIADPSLRKSRVPADPASA
jgi:hypothetical protein